MRLMMNVFGTALAVSCLALAACSGGGGTADPLSSLNGTAAAASVKGAAPSDTGSPNGTTIPSAAQITDSGGNVWTVSGGVISANGALAGYSNNVTLLLYDNNVIYQENSAGGWWSWVDNTWASSSDPRTVSSANGTAIPAATQITDGSGNVWAVSGGVIFDNGALAGYSANVTLLLYENGVIYQQNSAGGWWSWNGSIWGASSDPRTPAASANGTTIPGAAEITDASGNVWTVSGGVIYENGGLAGYSANATLLVYENGGIYQENSAGGWWSWNGNQWGSSSDPRGTTAPTGSATLSWNAPTQNTDGTPLTDLAGYTIYYGTSAGELTQTIQLTDPGATSYVVSNLSAGTYYFAVAAYTTQSTQGDLSSVESKMIL